MAKVNKPIYKPKGKAKEYGDYAINIYTGCPHECYYCYAPNVLRKDKEAFHNIINPREGIIEAVKKQVEREQITDRLIHLCFTCDPYPTGHDSTATREIIKILKEAGNHIQILTKGDGSRDFDLLDKNDWYGITYTGYRSMLRPPETEPHATAPDYRLVALQIAHSLGIKTWVSFEPVTNADDVDYMIGATRHYVDKVKIGKLNYHPSNIDLKLFGEQIEAKCKRYGIDYYIKDSLRNEMQKGVEIRNETNNTEK